MISKEEVRKLVLEVLQESAEQGRPRIRASAPGGPRTLIVFQAGVRRLEEALKQLPLLEAQAGWSGVYTVPAVRSRVCGADVRGEEGRPASWIRSNPRGWRRFWPAPMCWCYPLCA